MSGAPDDLLLIAGNGLSADDTVVYDTVVDSARPPAPPSHLPANSTPLTGLAPIVSAADVPYSLTVRLPPVMRANQTYAFWVHTPRGSGAGRS